MSMKLGERLALAMALSFLLSACGGGGGGGDATPAAAQPGDKLSAAASLGRSLFFDTNLSVSGRQSCATCHVPSRAHAADDGLPVAFGGPNGDLPGLRNAPSLNYGQYTPPFHFETDGTPVGGFFRDGRVNTLAEQAKGPFVNRFEMANRDAAEVVERLKTRPYLADFTALYGADVLNQPEAALSAMARAIAAYETEDASFHRFNSKFDAVVNGQATLTARELNGQRLFNDTTKGNCAACHVSRGSNGIPALFTDFTYDNIGVPRNHALAANDDFTVLDYVPANGAGLGAPDHRYYDLGLCGPLRADIANKTSLCGAFKVPTLRNIALTGPYFHNGVFATLREALTFYVSRDSDAARWYRKPDGTADQIYNDLPKAMAGNVNIGEVPYLPALQPALNDAEIGDVIAFLCTLTDGFDPAHPEAYALPDQCQNP